MNPFPSMLCDSHIHLFATHGDGTQHGPAASDDVSRYETLRSAHAIDIALVVGYEGEAIYRGNNSFILAQAEERPWIRPLAYIDPATTVSRVEALLARGFCGLSVYATRIEDAPEVADLLACIAPPLIERRALLSVNVIPELYSTVASAIDNWQELRILISHLGLPAAGGSDPARASAALHDLRQLAGPHAYVKASGFYALRSTVSAEDAIAHMLDIFGTQRVIWGSDYPPVLNHQSFAETVDGPWRSLLPDDSICAVMGDTLRRLLDNVERTTR